MSGIGAKKIIKFMAFLYLAALFYITLMMSDRYGTMFDQNNINLVPLSRKWYYFSHFSTLYDNEKFFIIREIIGNVLLFMPFSWALHIVLNKDFKKTAITGISILSVFMVESIQYFFHIGTFDVDDLILNISGALVGIFIFDALKKRFV